MTIRVTSDLQKYSRYEVDLLFAIAMMHPALLCQYDQLRLKC